MLVVVVVVVVSRDGQVRCRFNPGSPPLLKPWEPTPAAAAACRYITIANMPDQAAMPAYALRASCVNINPLSTRLGAAAAAAAANSSSSALKEGGMPCPVPSPGGKQCNGHGKCRVDSSVSLVEAGFHT